MLLFVYYCELFFKFCFSLFCQDVVVSDEIWFDSVTSGKTKRRESNIGGART